MILWDIFEPEQRCHTAVLSHLDVQIIAAIRQNIVFTAVVLIHDYADAVGAHEGTEERLESQLDHSLPTTCGTIKCHHSDVADVRNEVVGGARRRAKRPCLTPASSLGADRERPETREICRVLRRSTRRSCSPIKISRRLRTPRRFITCSLRH